MAVSDVDVWTISLAEPSQTGHESVLSADEEMRAARFLSDSHRDHWSRAHSMLRYVLSSYTRTTPRELKFETGPHGKPALARHEIEFNLSHAGDWAMIAVAPVGFPVGVDIERIRENVNIADLLKRIGVVGAQGSTGELFQLWARRESQSKAAGSPLMELPPGDYRTVDVTAPLGYRAALSMIGRMPHIRHRDTF